MFELIAMTLDTLPYAGRIGLLSALLATALYGFGRLVRHHPSVQLRVLYAKAAAVALLGVPAMVALLGIQMPVYVDQAEAFDTPLPGQVASALLLVWLLGSVVALWRLGKRLREPVAASEDLNTKLGKRLGHWCTRLSMSAPTVRMQTGAEPARLYRRTILLPAAAANWPTGAQDVLLLLQLALVRERVWSWQFYACVVVAIYWPLPLVKALFTDLADDFAAQSAGLARAAYRDPDGWRRDLKKLRQRYETLSAGGDEPSGQVGADSGVLVVRAALPEADNATDSALPSGRTRRDAIRRRNARNFDPYERVYWLIAVASLVVCVGTTLTIQQASPEFEPQFLKVRWQDQMQRRLTDAPDAALY